MVPSENYTIGKMITVSRRSLFRRFRFVKQIKIELFVTVDVYRTKGKYRKMEPLGTLTEWLLPKIDLAV
jgi:hypothetical protein